MPLKAFPNKSDVVKIHKLAASGKKAPTISKILGIKTSGVEAHLNPKKKKADPAGQGKAQKDATESDML